MLCQASHTWLKNHWLGCKVTTKQNKTAYAFWLFLPWWNVIVFRTTIKWSSIQIWITKCNYGIWKKKFLMDLLWPWPWCLDKPIAQRSELYKNCMSCVHYYLDLNDVTMGKVTKNDNSISECRVSSTSRWSQGIERWIRYTKAYIRTSGKIDGLVIELRQYSLTYKLVIAIPMPQM